MSQVKKITRIVLLLLLTSCRLFRSEEENAVKDIKRYERKLNRIYAEFPKLRVVDTVEKIVTISNPISKIDTVVLYKDTIIREQIYKRIVEKCKDTTLAREISYKLLNNYKCIKDSIVIKDRFYKAVIRQDTLGIHVNIIPNDSTLKAKFKVPCPPRPKEIDYFYSHQEFWFLAGLLFLTILGILIHLRLQK